MQRTTIAELKRILESGETCDGRRRSEPAVNVNRVLQEQRRRLAEFLAQKSRSK